jgi:hypothetical protein
MPLTGNAQPFNRQQPKRQKGPNKEAHTPNTKYGMGDNYGSGVRAKIGTMREDSMGMIAMTPNKLKKPPKSTA